MTEKEVNKIENWLEERKDKNIFASRLLGIIKNKPVYAKEGLIRKFVHFRRIEMILNEKEHEIDGKKLAKILKKDVENMKKIGITNKPKELNNE
jgi:hypothetical protein